MWRQDAAPVKTGGHAEERGEGRGGGKGFRRKPWRFEWSPECDLARQTADPQKKRQMNGKRSEVSDTDVSNDSRRALKPSERTSCAASRTRSCVCAFLCRNTTVTRA